jgi:hypothetical protein
MPPHRSASQCILWHKLYVSLPLCSRRLRTARGPPPRPHKYSVGLGRCGAKSDACRAVRRKMREEEAERRAAKELMAGLNLARSGAPLEPRASLLALTRCFRAQARSSRRLSSAPTFAETTTTPLPASATSRASSAYVPCPHRGGAATALRPLSCQPASRQPG